MLTGTYVFKQNGIEIGRSQNIITNNGKTAILQYLSNSLSEWASSIAVGAISTTPTSSDLTLSYELARTPVTLKSYISGTPNLIVVKGTLANTIAANIYEVGVYNGNTSQIFGTRDQLILDDFSTITNWSTTSGSAYTTNAYAAQSPYSPRIGLYSVNMAASSTIKNSQTAYNLSAYSTLDSIDILVSVPIASTGSQTLTLLLTDINGLTSTLTYSFNGSTKSGYQVLSQVFPSSIFSLSTISSISLTSTAAIIVDALRVSVNAEITNTTGLVSRSALSTPIAKIYGSPLDIEYYLQLS
jgi:hypothetical protein